MDVRVKINLSEGALDWMESCYLHMRFSLQTQKYSFLVEIYANSAPMQSVTMPKLYIYMLNSQPQQGHELGCVIIRRRSAEVKEAIA